jgi:hypothetical protein
MKSLVIRAVDYVYHGSSGNQTLPAMSMQPLLIALLCLALLILPVSASTVVTSPDGLVTLTSPEPLVAILGIALPVSPPEDWVPIGEGYLIDPPDLVITSPAILTFTIPSELTAESDTVIFIAYSGNRGWEMLPSRVQETTSGTVISAPVSMPGVYSLMTRGGAEEEPSPPQTEAGLGQVIPLSAALFALFIFIRRKP